MVKSSSILPLISKLSMNFTIHYPWDCNEYWDYAFPSLKSDLIEFTF